MIRKRAIWLIPTLALAACSGASAAETTATVPDSTVVETTVPETTEAPTTTHRPRPTTTTAPEPTLSREARVALHQCLDAVGIPENLPAMAIIGGNSYLEEAMTLCEEAGTQVSVDGFTDLAVQLADLNFAIARLNVDWVTGALEPDGSGVNPAADAFTEFVRPLLSEIEKAA